MSKDCPNCETPIEHGYICCDWMECQDLKRKLRKAQQAVRIVHQSEWMVTHDWGGDRDAMWACVKNLAGVRRWTHSRKKP